MKQLLRTTVLFFLLIPLGLHLQATNFYTLTSGDYTDAVGVWSTDGTTFCNCAPGATVSGLDSVFIRHDLDLPLLSFQNGAVLTINPGVNATSFQNFSLVDGFLFNYGVLNLGSVTISNGTFTSNGIVDVTQGNFFNIGGTVDLTGAVSVSGSYRNLNFGTLVLRTNSSMEVGTFFFNIGTTVTEAGACINVVADFVNPEIGQVIGSGHIASGFNITNDGAWDVNTSWCAGALGTGLPGAPNCISCGPLPVTLASFEAVYRREDRRVDIQWATSSEVNNDHFVLERSRDGIQFEPLAQVRSQVRTGVSGSYEHQDAHPFDGINYYRLRQVDQDGSEAILETARVYVNEAVETEIQVYPNPSQGPFHYQASLPTATTLSIEVFDLRGQLVYQENQASALQHQGLIDLSRFGRGTYLVRIQAGSYQQTETLRLF